MPITDGIRKHLAQKALKKGSKLKQQAGPQISKADVNELAPGLEM